jgi:hypothetical protein
LEFQPSIVLLKERRPVEWATIEIVREQRKLTLRDQLPHFTLEQSSIVECLSCPAARLTYTWRTGAVLLRQAMQLWLADDELFSATFTDLAVQFLESLPMFQRWLEEVGFQGTRA